MKISNLIFRVTSLMIVFVSLPNCQTITLDQFLDQLQRVHPLFEKERLGVEIERERQKSYLGGEDWYITSSPYYSRQNPLPPGSFTPTSVDQINLGATAQRAFWKTGGRLSFSWSSDITDQDLPDLSGLAAIFDVTEDQISGPSKFYQNEFAVTYTHPLLRNRSGFLDRLQYDIQQFGIDFSEVQAVENQEDFLAMTAGKFLDWILLTEQRKIIEDRMRLSNEELARTQSKRKANLVDEVDVIRAADAVRIAKQNQVLIKSRWNALQAELAVLSVNSDIYNVSPEFDLNKFDELMSLDSARMYLYGYSRIIKTFNIRLKQLKYAQKGYVETLKPDLSLITKVNTKQLDENLSDSFDMSKTDAFVGLQFSLPLENRTAKSQITQSDLQIMQLEKQLYELGLTLTSTLTNIYIQIDELKEVLILNEEQILSAQKRTEEELKLYNQGRGDMTFVIQSQDSEKNSKLTYAVNAVTYHKLIIAYKSLMDQLLKI